MNLNQYQALALRTEAPMPTRQDRLEHAALGLFSEGGELTTQIKRIAIYGKTLDSLDKGKSLRSHIAEETGDVMWYLAIISDVLGVNIFADHVPVMLPAEYEITLKHPAFALGSVVGSAIDAIMDDGFNHDELLEMAKASLAVLETIALLTGTTLEQIAADNIAKLTLRYPDKFSAEAAEARADKGGLDARNS